MFRPEPGLFLVRDLSSMSLKSGSYETRKRRHTKMGVIKKQNVCYFCDVIHENILVYAITPVLVPLVPVTSFIDRVPFTFLLKFPTAWKQLRQEYPLL